MLKIAIVAGESSGDLLASKLMQQLKLQYPNIEFFGVGGALMQEQGLVSYFNMEILSIGGYGLDILSAIPRIVYLRYKLIKEILQFKPDVFIGVDAPDFNFYVERKLKQHGIKTVHYISPTIWAWRYNRIYSIKKSTDLMLCIFPMEEPIYHKENILAKFVGHPLAIEIPANLDQAKARTDLELLQNMSNLFTVLLGSRIGEIERFSQTIIDACSLIFKQIPNATFLFPLNNYNTYNRVVQLFEEKNVAFPYKILFNQTRNAIIASDMVIAKSGTVTLEVALCKKPLIICYRVSKFTKWLLEKRLTIKFVGQPNILLNEMVAPEILQDALTPDNLANEFMQLYKGHNCQQQMIDKFHKLHQSLLVQNSATSAQAILELIGK